MPFERPATVNEPSDKFPAQSFAVRDGSKTLDFDLSALAIDGSWTFPAPAAGDAAKVLFGDGTWQAIPGGGDMLGANNLSDLTNAGTARTNLGLGSLATLSTVGTAQITDSAVTDAKITSVATNKLTGTIATAQIADNAVTDVKITSVATNKLTGTIGTAQITDSAVTDVKIAAVATSKLTGTIGTTQIANSAVTDAKIDTMNANKLTGSIAPARVGLTVDKTLPYNNAGTMAGSNIILDGVNGRSLWIAQDDAASFFRIGSNLNIFTWLRNDGHNFLRTATGNALYINDNSDAITNIATGTGNTTLGNNTGTTAIYGSTLTIQGTTLKINVGSDAAGDIYYRDASGNFVRLAKGTDGQVLTLASGLPSWAAAGGAVKEVIARVKTARETVTSSSVLQDDDHFSFPVKANTTYQISGVLFVSAANAVGFKWLFTVPSGATGRLNITAFEAALDGLDIDVTAGQSTSTQLTITGNGNGGTLSGFITTSGTAGTVLFRWAQNASNAAGTYIERGSSMVLTEV